MHRDAERAAAAAKRRADIHVALVLVYMLRPSPTDPGGIGSVTVQETKDVPLLRSRQPEATVDAIVARTGAGPVLIILTLLLLLPGLFTLPPMDRDEPRFAQASKQMLETSDFVAIRFGAEARNKKPVGIHWLQASAVSLGESLGVPDARHQIWLYRLPSLFGALLAVLLTYWAALPMVARGFAMLAALFVAATPLLGVEARLATTDAVLLATVVAAMGALARAYLARDGAAGWAWQRPSSSGSPSGSAS